MSNWLYETIRKNHNEFALRRIEEDEEPLATIKLSDRLNQLYGEDLEALVNTMFYTLLSDIGDNDKILYQPEITQLKAID